MNELISVIINVYNGEKYINKCIDSVINQTYKNLEILIINDGSTDNTLSIINEYNDKRIRVITTENLGLSLSRNIGIDNAKGEYLYFIDVDDFIELDTIEYLYSLLINNNAKISTCKTLETHNYNYKLKNKKEKIEILKSENMLKKNLLSEDYTINFWNKLYNKSLFKNIRFEDRIINDLAITYKIIIESKNIVFSNQIKYFYLRNDDSITVKRKTNLERNIDIYDVSIERYNNIKRMYPQLYENEIGLMRNIVFFYTKQNKDLHLYLDGIGAKELFKNLFSIKIIKYKMKKTDKLIIILFRISPKLYASCLKKYLYFKNIIKQKRK